MSFSTPPGPPGPPSGYHQPMMPPPRPPLGPIAPVVVRKGFPVWLALVLAGVMGIGGCTVGVGIGAAGKATSAVVADVEPSTAASTAPSKEPATKPAAKPSAQASKAATKPAAPKSTAPEPAEPKKAAAPGLGDAVPFDGRNGEGTLSIESAKWTKRGMIEPDSGNYLILDVLVRGTDGTVAYNPLYFKVQDADGREYNIAFGADAEPSLKSGKLDAGDKARGYIGFDVKKGPVTVTVTDELLQDVASIDIPG